MPNPASLSLEQAPPLHIPFRFLLSAPLFGILAGVLLLISGPDILLSRWSPRVLALTHLVTLGFLTMAMCGALFQMLPVLAGSPVPRVSLVGTLVHLLLSAGTLSLVAAFLSGSESMMKSAMAGLGGAFVLFLGAVGTALWRVGLSNATIAGIRLAVASFGVVGVLGLVLAAGHLGYLGGQVYLLVDVHLAWGLLGWIGILLIAVSYQVVPMFQVTPEYPRTLQVALSRTLFTAIVCWTLLRLTGWGEWLADLSLALCGVGYLLYAFFTLHVQSRRKRRVQDITLMFWRIGMSMICSALLLWAASRFAVEEESAGFTLLLGVVLLQGVGIAVVNGMLYKIIPFLSWFHLQHRQMALMAFTVSIPNMKDLLPDRLAKGQFRLYVVSLGCMLGAVMFPQWLIYPAALSFLCSNAFLLYNLLHAVGRYRTASAELAAAIGEGAAG